MTSEDSEQAEQFLYRSSGQIGSGHHRHLINAAQMSDEGPQPYIVVPSRPCNHLDHEIAATLDYPPHAVARFCRSPRQTGVAREVDEDTVLHDQMKLRIPYLST